MGLRLLRSKYFLLLLLVAPLIVHSVTLPSASAGVGVLYQTTWGTANFDYGQAITQDSAGNTYVAGYTWGFTPGTPSIILLKFSYTGVLLFQKLWSDSAFDYAYGIALDKSGNIYVSGWTNNNGGPSLLLLKFNSVGGLLWQRTWGGSNYPSYGQSVAVDPSGNIYVAGYYTSTSSSDQNATLVKFDPIGDLLWARRWGGGTPSQARSVALDSSGNIYVTGFTTSFGNGGADVFLLKFNSTGSLRIETTWGGSGDDKGNGIAVDSAGNAYVTGSTLSLGVVSDVFLLKYNSAGSLLGQRSYAQPSATIGYSIAVNSTTRQVWITGTNNTGSYSKGLNLRFDASTLNLLSQTGWGGLTPGSDAGYAIAPDISGNAVITGIVSESAPYKNTTMTGAEGTPSLTITSPTAPAVDPGLISGFAGGSVTSPVGSSTYAGGTDILVSKYGDEPLISIQSNHPSVGLVNFAGYNFPVGQNVSFAYGNYTASISPPVGYSFVRWNASGGVIVSRPYDNPARVRVIGSGILLANLTITIANITVNITPSTGGTLTCNGQTVIDGQIFQIHVNTTLTCNANPYVGHKFINYTGLDNLVPVGVVINPKTNPFSFNVTQGGSFHAYFTAPLPVQPTSLLAASLLTVVVAVFVRRLPKPTAFLPNRIRRRVSS